MPARRTLLAVVLLAVLAMAALPTSNAVAHKARWFRCQPITVRESVLLLPVDHINVKLTHCRKAHRVIRHLFHGVSHSNDGIHFRSLGFRCKIKGHHGRYVRYVHFHCHRGRQRVNFRVPQANE